MVIQHYTLTPAEQAKAAAQMAEIRANVASINAIPWEQLPSVAARLELLRRAQNGEEVYAYTPACSDQYTLWIDSGNPAQDDRHNPAEWAQAWLANTVIEAIAVANATLPPIAGIPPEDDLKQHIRDDFGGAKRIKRQNRQKGSAA